MKQHAYMNAGPYGPSALKQIYLMLSTHISFWWNDLKFNRYGQICGTIKFVSILRLLCSVSRPPWLASCSLFGKVLGSYQHLLLVGFVVSVSMHSALPGRCILIWERNTQHPSWSPSLTKFVPGTHPIPAHHQPTGMYNVQSQGYWGGNTERAREKFPSFPTEYQSWDVYNHMR